jgi:protein-L-isoaspartate(D-aspartate) O-methyltransferase
MTDSFMHKGLRKKLLEELKIKGISNANVLKAFWDVPRHWFIDAEFDRWAYRDTAFKIDAEQTISQPYTVAFMSQLLEVTQGEKILEVGTGSGFQACILSAMGAKVYTIERHEILYQKTSKLLQKIGFSDIRTLYGDGYQGSPRFAPFDKIIITAGATTIPKVLLSQLKIGGTLLLPIGEDDIQKMMKITRTSELHFTREEFGDFQFVPFLEGTVDV